MKKFLLLFLLSMIFGIVHSQSDSYCPNSNFSDGNFGNWLGETGWCCPIALPMEGIANGRHTIVSGVGMDPNSCGNITLVPNGYLYSARLGNDQTGSQAEGLKYVFNVTEDSDLLIYKYAVVLQDPGHSPQDQPRFVASVTDQNGNLITCTQYAVTAAQGLEGFDSCPFGEVIFRDWTTVGVDLSSYLGQSVTLEFQTGDCTCSGHYGYAYVVAECRRLELESRFCVNGGGTATLTAPEGFTYLWSTGQTDQEIEIANPVQGATVTCQITSVTGCQATLEAILTPSDVGSSFVTDYACTSDAMFTNTSTVLNGELQSVSWSVNNGPVVNTPNFVTDFPVPGTYEVSLQIVNDAGCVGTSTQQIVIEESPEVSFVSPGICLGSEVLFDSQIDFNDPSETVDLSWVVEDIVYDVDDILLTGDSISTFDIALVANASNGCSDVYESTYTVFPLPEALTADFTLCTDEPIMLNHTSVLYSANPAFNYEILDLGFTSTDEFPQLETVLAGIYELRLIVEDHYNGLTCYDTTFQTITVSQGPVAGISGDPYVCDGEQFALSQNSIIQPGDAAQFDWYNNNVAAANGQNYQFSAPVGTEDVSLIVLSQNGCSDTAYIALEVYSNPTISITLDTTQCLDFLFNPDVVITNASGNMNAVEWFMDGTLFSSLEEPIFTITEPGTHDIVVNATSGDANQQCPVTESFQIEAFPLPEGQITVTDSCTSLFTAHYNASVVYGSIDSFEWYLDGASFSTNDTLSFTLPEPGFGNHLVQLEMISNYGCSTLIGGNEFVHDLPDVDFDVVQPCVGDGFLVLESSTTTEDFSDVVSVYWNNFTTGQQSTGNDWILAIPDTGQYNIELTAISEFGCVDSSNRWINTYSIPVAAFTIDSICQFGTVNPVNLSTSDYPNLTYSWTINGSPVSTSFEPAFNPQNADEMVVQLVAANYFTEGFCADTTSHFWSVLPAPLPAIITDSLICLGENFLFSDNTQIANEEPYLIDWTYNGASLGTLPDAMVTSPEVGFYNISLHSYTAFCENTVTLPLEVYNIPELIITPVDTALCQDQPLTIFGSAFDYSGNLIDQFWMWEETLLTSGPNLQLNNSIPGEFEYHYHVITGTGAQQCAQEAVAHVSVWANPIASFELPAQEIFEDSPIVRAVNVSQGYEIGYWYLNHGFAGQDSILTMVFPKYDPDTQFLCLEVFNEFGCQDSICGSFEIQNIPAFYVPNAFTPNNDGINDLFAPVIDSPELISEYHLIIFDRWGSQVFETNEYYKKWNGSFRDSEYFVKDDVYQYIVKYKQENFAEMLEAKGFVLITR